MTIEELQAEAERLFPFPIRCCAFARKKILWQREKWINEKLKHE